MSIFQKSVVNKYLKSLDENTVNQAFETFNKYFKDHFRLTNIMLLKEENYQEGFLRELFVEVLGYTINPNKNYNLTTEFKNQTDSKKADGAIIKNNQAIGVIELKSTKLLDLKFIEKQAFNYKNNQPNCKYVITSTFRFLRFYIENSTQYEEFDLFYLDYENFKLLYLFLSKESVFNEIPLRLKDETKFHEETISQKFYKNYKQFKEQIFENLVKQNKQYDKIVLLKKTQKLLDRILFIAFAEDKGLLPPNALSRTIEKWKNLIKEGDNFTLYSRYQLFFHHLNVGFTIPDWGVIPEYNGGLYAFDDILDNKNLIIDNNIIQEGVLNIAKYDFNTEIDVNILGHIFEHSLNELDEIISATKGSETEKKETKRKKDGVFYTPDYITKYIVENTVGELCEKKKFELGLVNFQKRQDLKDKKNKLTKTGKEYFVNLQTYKNWLFDLKIIDPACGSGAFLIATLDFLISEHKQTDDLIYQLTGEALKLFDTDKNILEKNIYGVDINEESVEIAKLSLWLHTAKKERKLSNLSNNLKCGNSLIDSKNVAGEKAFVWETEFSEILKNDGFDCVIGNPPYVRSRDLDNYQNEYINSKYKFIQSGFDLATLFIEKGISLLKTDGNLGFITTNKFFTARYGQKLRKYLIDNQIFRSIINLKSGIFADTPVETAILIISNQKNDEINYTQLKPVDAHIKIEPTEILNFETIQKAPNYIVYLPIEQKQKIINSKIQNCDFKLKDFFEFSAGAGITGIENKLENKQTTNNNIPVFTGSNVWRYFSTEPSYWTSDYAIRNYNAKNYILVRELSTKNRAVFLDTDNKISGLNSITFVKPSKNEDDKYKFILLFNSNLFGHLYELFYETTRTHSNLRYKEIYLSEIPIFDLSNLNTELCKELFKSIYELTTEKNTIENNLINLLQSDFKNIKITNKLNSWHLLNHVEFIDEIKKQKFDIKLPQKNEWIKYFAKEQKNISPIVEKIKNIDNQINKMIYQFYKLTKEEITLIEGTTKV